jgi:hypothetical protein
MRKKEVASLLFTFIVTAALSVQGQNWQIVPGRSAGPINKDTSEAQLAALFGRANVRRMTVDVGEGEKRTGTVLFPNDPKKKAYILWRDTETRLHPESVSIRNRNTLWKTDRGITIGTSLRMLERLNGRAFAISGFAWDYEGTVLHSNGGKMSELGTGSGERIAGRTLLLRLSPSERARKMREYQKVLGDGTFLSNNIAMRRINPGVYEMIVEFPE